MSPLGYHTSFTKEQRPTHERTWRAHLERFRRKLIRAAVEFGDAWSAENRPTFTCPREALEGALKIVPDSPEFERAPPRLRRAVTNVFAAQDAYREASRKGPPGDMRAGKVSRKRDRSVR